MSVYYLIRLHISLSACQAMIEFAVADSVSEAPCGARHVNSHQSNPSSQPNMQNYQLFGNFTWFETAQIMVF
jgi:hypothetical protein